MRLSSPNAGCCLFNLPGNSRILASLYQFSWGRERAFARDSFDAATKALASFAPKG
jgi:hypothetical protein